MYLARSYCQPNPLITKARNTLTCNQTYQYTSSAAGWEGHERITEKESEYEKGGRWWRQQERRWTCCKMYVSDHRLVLAWFLQTHVTTRYAVKVRWSNYLVLGVGTVGCTGIVSEYSVSIVQGYPDTFSTVTHDQWWISQLRNFVCGHVVRPCRTISWYVRPNYVFFKEMFRRSALPATRKSSVELPSYEGYNYVSIIASSVV